MIYIVLIANIVVIGGFVYLYKNKKQVEISTPVSNLPKTRNKLDSKKLVEEVMQKAKNRAESLIEKTEELAETQKQNLEEKEAEVVLMEEEISEREKTIVELVDQSKRKAQSVMDIEKHNTALESELVESLTKISGEDRKTFEENTKKTLQERIAKYFGKIEKQAEFFTKNNAEDISVKQIDLILPNAYMELNIDLETNNTFIKFDDTSVLRQLSEDRKFAETIKKETDVDIEYDIDRREVVISSMDPVRREVVFRVISDFLNSRNRSNFNLQKAINFSKRDVLEDVKRTGEQICSKLGFKYLPERLKVSIGKCKYRFSYGQNLLKHSVEMVLLGEAIANLIGADVEKARLACFLHDIGKVEPEGEKPHHHISADMVKELYSDDEVLYNAIISHHFDVEALYPESFVVLLADSISGSRPGARRNSAEEYFERVNAMIDIASKHNFVRQSFVIKGGREVRVLIDSNQTKDSDADKIAEKVAKEVEETLSYPGSVLVNVIRETVVTEKANKNLD